MVALLALHCGAARVEEALQTSSLEERDSPNDGGANMWKSLQRHITGAQTLVENRVHFPVIYIAGWANSFFDYKDNSTNGAWASVNFPSPNVWKAEQVLSMTWNDDTKVASNAPGVEIRFRNGGGWDSVMLGRKMPFFKPLVDIGYEEDVTLMVHPWDWRQSAAGWMQQDFPRLKDEIKAAQKRQGRKVVVATSSGGAPYFSRFVAWAGSRWARQHVEAIVSFSGSYSGSVQALQQGIGGVLGADITKTSCPRCEPKVSDASKPLRSTLLRLSGMLDTVDEPIRRAQRSAPGSYWLMPKLDYSTNPVEDPLVVVMTQKDENVWEIGGNKGNTTHYRVSQLPELFRALGDETGAKMMAYALSESNATTQDPGVPVHCLISHNVMTPEALFLKNGKIEAVTMGDGDGTVTRSSIDVCTRWKSTVKTYAWTNARHAQPLSDGVDVLIAVATNNQSSLKDWQPVRGWVTKLLTPESSIMAKPQESLLDYFR